MTDSSDLRGLSPRAQTFVSGHGIRLSTEAAQRSAADWLKRGVDPEVVQKAVDYDLRWGNLYLPPSLAYNGGPLYLGSEILSKDWTARGCIGAGPPRFSTSYDFIIDSAGTFGIGEVDFVPLYGSVEDWIESLALEYTLRRLATVVRRMSKQDLSAQALSDMAPFPGISGRADSWLIDDDSIIYLCRGRALLSKYPDDEFAISYTGIADRESALDIDSP